jgi:hypothetical protein
VLPIYELWRPTITGDKVLNRLMSTNAYTVLNKFAYNNISQQNKTLFPTNTHIVCCNACYTCPYTFRYGAERSGLFCALMYVLTRIILRNEVDVFNAVRQIRQSRPEFIQTEVGTTASQLTICQYQKLKPVFNKFCE